MKSGLIEEINSGIQLTTYYLLKQIKMVLNKWLPSWFVKNILYSLLLISSAFTRNVLIAKGKLKHKKKINCRPFRIRRLRNFYKIRKTIGVYKPF